MVYHTPVTSKNMKILIISEFNEIRLGTKISQDDSNGEVRFLIRDLEIFRFSTCTIMTNYRFAIFQKKNAFFQGFTLTTHGITHLTTPPHTPKHNGYFEPRHRHIGEKILTLLHQASIPLTFWSYAFATTVYLINRMPKIGLSLGSSFENLFNRAPDPSKLCVFGCLCFSWLRPYSSHKLNPKFSPCVFLGYSLTQSAFLYFDHTLKKILVSCHVKLVENVF